MPTFSNPDSGYRYWTDDAGTIRLEFTGQTGQWVCDRCGLPVSEKPGKDFDTRAQEHIASHQG
jgi:hypothetical protein